MTAHFLYKTPYAERIDLRCKPTMALLRWDDAEGSAAWGFEHICQEWPDDQEPDGKFVKVVAPRLTNHTVTRNADGITVRASILCRDCGAHGFITDSKWVNA